MYITYNLQPMSIIIKSDELNILIYKYLQECNLTHTAFNLFNQANLEQSLTQYKYDVKSGQLVSLIQRALVFSQIQSHITVNDYEECKQPFMLLKPHVCKITQKIKADKEKFLQQLNQIAYTSIRRTNSIHNVLQPNREYQEIIYDQRSPNFLDRIPLRLQDCEKRIIKSHISSKNQKSFCAYDSKTNTITIMQVNQKYLSPISIIPCMTDLVTFELINENLITISQDNIVEIMKIKDGSVVDQVTRLKIPLESPCIQIKLNKRITQLILFQAQHSYVLINTNSRKRLASGKGIFEWIQQFQYLVLEKQQKTINQYSLKNSSDSSTKQFVCDLQHPERIKVSFSEMYFSLQSIEENKVLVYNFDSQQPIYIFDFNQIEKSTGQSIEENIQSVVWVNANSSDSLIFITQASIKTFEVTLNNFSKIIEIGSYDTQIEESAVLKKNDEQMYLICSGVKNLIFYDVSLGKIQRVQKNAEQTYPLINMSRNEYVIVIGRQRVYFLQPSDVDSLFL